MNVLSGKKGWHKRVQRSMKAVERSTELTDEVSLDAGAASKMFAAAKASVIKKHPTAATITLLQQPAIAASWLYHCSEYGIVTHGPRDQIRLD